MAPKLKRLDAGERIFFARELETLDQKTYDVKQPLLKARMLIPKITDVGEWDTEYTYQQFEQYGEAEIVADTTTDLPVATVTGREFTARIKPVGLAYKYTIPEIRAAIRKNKPLADRKAMAARRGTEQKIDKLLAFGSTTHGMKGFINQSVAEGGLIDATTFVASTKTGGGTTWLNGTATSAEILGDINRLLTQVWNALEEAEGLTGRLTIVLPATQYALIATQPIGDNSDKTILSFVLANNPFLEDIVPWTKLTGAGAAGVDRMVCYARDPQNVGALIPLEWSREEEQLVGITFTIPTLATCGGTVIRYPIAFNYGDGI